MGQNLIPDDIFVSRSKIGKVEFDAIKTSGDGNCLYRSASLILVGNEDLHLLLRLLTAIELFLHASYYVRHPKFLSGMRSPSADVPEDIMFTLCLSDTGMKMWESTKCREDAIKREAATGCRVSKWSVMVHLMALTNVIGRTIFSAFPKDCSKTRPFFHDEIIPRECSFHADPAVMLWSREGSPNTHPAGWYQPNHFIPLVERRSCSANSKASTSSSDNKKHHKDELKKKPKRNISDFFCGSVRKKPCQEPMGSSTEPKFGNCDEQSFVKSNLSTATPSKSQPLNGDPSKSLPERTLPKEENTERTTEKNSEKKRKREFKGHWKETYPWLEHDASNDVMYCMVCRKYPKLADITSPLYRGTGGIGKYRLETLKSHNGSANHLKCVNRSQMDQGKADEPLPKLFKAAFSKRDQETEARLHKLFNTAFYIANENLAFSKSKGLCDLQEKNGLDFGTQYKNDKACRDFVESIAAVEKERSQEEIENARFLCVLADGSTDKSITEQESVYVRCTGSNGRPSTHFADLVPVTSADAPGVTAAIQKGLQTLSIDETVLKKKLACCNFDGASVMMGKKSGVAKQLQDIAQHPVCIIHCVAHNLELAVLDAIKQTPYLAIFEETVKSVFKFYFYSPKRRREVNEIAAILDQDHVYYSGLQKTRWVASRFRAINALERYFLTTVTHLQHKSQTKGDDGAKAKGILQNLQSEKFVKFLYFLLDVMKVLSDLSKSFQRDEFCITDLLVHLEAGISQLDVLKLQRGPKYQAFEKRYNGQTGVLKSGVKNNHELKLSKPGTTVEDGFPSFIAEVIAYINQRFSSLREEPYSYFTVFDPKEMPQDQADLATYGNKEVRSLVDYFHHFFSDDEKQRIIEQWPILHQRLARQKMHKTLDVFSNILMSPPDDVKDCLVLIDLLITLSPSTAKCERGFSTMNQLKYSMRTLMNQDTLTALMRVRSSNLNVTNFCPTPAIQRWMSGAKTKRHVDL